MLAWLKQRVAGWFAGSTPATSAAAPVQKGKTGATLTDFMSGSSGLGSSLSSQYSDARALAMNRNWVHACVRVIAQRIAGRAVRVGRTVGGKPVGSKRTKATAAHPPWVRAGDVKELTAHKLIEALGDPNPYCVSWSLLYLIVASLELTGRAYIWADTEDDALRLWYLPSSWVMPDPDAKLPLTRFIVSPSNSGQQFRLSSDELCLIQLPNPADPLTPLSPLAAGASAAELDEDIQTAQLAKFANGGLPGLVATIGSDAASSPLGDPDDAPVLTVSQRRVLASRIRDWTSGALKAGEPLIKDGFLKDVQRFDKSPQEVDFQASGQMTKSRILQLFGVNPIVIGEIENANKASSLVAEQHLVSGALQPLCVLIGQTLTRWFRLFFSDPSLVVWLDPPTARDDDSERADWQQAIGAGAVTVNEVRARLGLPDREDGDVLVKAPAPQQPAPAANPPTARDDDTKSAEPISAVEAHVFALLQKAREGSLHAKPIFADLEQHPPTEG